MIRLIQFALRKPWTVFVLVAAILLFSVLAIRKSSIDIFPAINAPTIYVAQTYGGLSPQQMEGFITSYYEYHFLYITGIKAVESKSIQGLVANKIRVSGRNEYGGRHGRSRFLCNPGTFIYAAGYIATFYHALRCRIGSGGTTGVQQ